MICLTGDVHHMSLRTSNQRFIPDENDTEVKVTQRYVALLEKYGIKATLYICGKCFTEEWDDLKPVAGSPLVEVGGAPILGASAAQTFRLVREDD